MSDSKKPAIVKLYVAVDIEAFGHADNLTPFSVGFCYGTSWDDRKKFRVTMIPTGPHTYYSGELSGKSNEEYGKMIRDSLNNPEEFSKVMQIFCDPVTWSEFWSKNQEILRKLFSDDNMMSTQVGMLRISDFLKELYANEKTNTKTRIIWLGDNPAYDFSHLNRAVSTYCDELPVRYSNRLSLTDMRYMVKIGKTLPTDGYHGISDPSEAIDFHPNAKLIEEIVDKHSAHTHMPDDDAEGIFLQQLLLKTPELVERLR
jgi:hypothetical protein